jgi:predicted DNA-binding transcriptional regulator AlpA
VSGLFLFLETHMEVQPRYLNREQAAAFLHVQPKTLANWASQGKGPRFRKPGGRVVLYTQDDLEAWVDGRH